MRGAVEARKERLAWVTKELTKELTEKGKADFENFIVKIQIATGVTDKKAREYMRLLMVHNDLTTEFEQTNTGRVFWIKKKGCGL